MKLISLKIKGFKNLDFWKNPIDFTKSEGISIFVGNNGSGKSNVLEAISAIFYGLYDETNERRCAFSYELEYEKDGKRVFIKQDFNIIDGLETRGVGYFVDGIQVRDISNLLPSQIIALYSGEETRLYEEYYMDEYSNFVEDVVYGTKSLQDKVKMSFIDKSFWSVALLTFAIFEEKINYSWKLKIPKVSDVYFYINESTVKIFQGKIPNEMYDFLSSIKNEESISIEELRRINEIGVYEDFFKMLSVAMLTHKDKYRMIDFIEIFFNIDGNTFSANGLSEGQKKQILIYFVTQILAEKDSIILLDEPDSYIHVGNKQRLKEFFDDFLSITKEGEFIMTTHSPTLMNKFDKKHLFYLENGKLDLKEKREILDKITDGQMSLNEMEVFLNSGNKYLLVTEGITDKKHLEIAIEKLGIKNNYDIYSADGADKLKQFLVGLPKGFFINKIIIGIFDYDTEGLNNLKIGDQIEENKIYRVRDRDNIFGITLPYYDEKFANYKNFTIEFMYSEEILKKYNMLEKRKLTDVNCGVKNQDLILSTREFPNENHLCFFKISETNISKNNFTDKVRELESSEFINFKVLFDLIDSF